MSVTVYVTQQFYRDDIRWKAAENLDCAIKIFLYLFKQLWCLTKNIPIERIENGAMFTEGQGDMQFSVNANMQIGSTEISYKSKSQNLAFRSTYLRSFEGENSLRKYYFVLGINCALLSISISAFEPPFPSEFPMTFRRGCLDIFWNHTFGLQQTVLSRFNNSMALFSRFLFLLKRDDVSGSWEI